MFKIPSFAFLINFLIMKTKKKIFDIPFIGYDEGKTHGWNFDVLIGKYGNPVIGIKIKNIVEQYSADPDGYMAFHSLLNQVISIVGEGFIVQKTDIFSKKKYSAEYSDEFLQQKYSEHFDGRYFKTIDTLLIFTELIDDKSKKKNKYKFNENKYKVLRDKSQKVLMLLQQNECEASFLKKKDFDYYIDRSFSMKFSDVPTFDNYKVNDTYIKIGNNFIETISFVDVEDISLPTTIAPFSFLGGSGAAADTAVDNFSFFNELEDYNAIIYNQVISIPLQGQRQIELEKKKRKHESAGAQSPSNLLIAEEIDALMVDVATNSQLIVDAHFSMAFSSDSKEKMEKLHSLIESKLFTKGIRISQRSTNQLELFRACIPGNAVELKDYDYFTTTSEGASCFFF